MLFRKFQDNLILDAGCRYNLFESRKAAECLSGTWLLARPCSPCLMAAPSFLDLGLADLGCRR